MLVLSLSDILTITFYLAIWLVGLFTVFNATLRYMDKLVDTYGSTLSSTQKLVCFFALCLAFVVCVVSLIYMLL